MRRLVVLGAGTAGTMVVNKLRSKLPRAEWSITIVDPATQHYYQPGFLFLPFGTYQPKDVVRPLRPTLNLTKGIELISAAVDKVDGPGRLAHLDNGAKLGYDYLTVSYTHLTLPTKRIV